MNRLNRSRSFPFVVPLLVAFAFSAIVPDLSEAAPTHRGATLPPYEVQVVVDGVPLPEYLHEGTVWVEGRKDRRYALRLINRTGRRVEVVASVDGLDVMDGKPADYRTKRGYVLEPWQTYDVEGFRLDLGRVAAFRFSSVADSYAAKTGNARNVGVIGVAFFEERRPPRLRPRPMPVVPPTFNKRDGWEGRAQLHDADATASAEAAPMNESAEAPSAAAFDGAETGGLHRTRAAGASSGERTASRAGRKAERSGLGTAFGESRESRVSETTFVRANAHSPSRMVVLKYNDRAGLRAQGVIQDSPPPSDRWLRATADPFPATPKPRRFAQPPRGWHE